MKPLSTNSSVRIARFAGDRLWRGPLGGFLSRQQHEGVMGARTQEETAEIEAADWHRRLGTRVISSQAIHDFFAWRSDPVRAEAYRRVEADWEAARRIPTDAVPNLSSQRRTKLQPAAIAALATAFVGGVIAAHVAHRIGSRAGA